MNESNELGDELNPVSNNEELSIAILGKSNCIIYTKGTFSISEENYIHLKEQNILLIGIAFLRLGKAIEKTSNDFLKSFVYGTNDNKTYKGLLDEINKEISQENCKKYFK